MLVLLLVLDCIPVIILNPSHFGADPADQPLFAALEILRSVICCIDWLQGSLAQDPQSPTAPPGSETEHG